MMSISVPTCKLNFGYIPAWLYLIGASLSEPHMVISTVALSICLYVYVSVVRVVG